MEVAALIGSYINNKVKNVAANENYDKFDINYVYKRVKLKWEKNKVNDDSKSLNELINEFKMKDEISAVGAGIGEGFKNTKELHVMK